MIVGFAGRKRSGKSTAARYLIDRGYVPYSFAEPLKEMAAVLLRRLGLDDEDLQAVGNDKEGVIYPIEKSLRQVLQTLGTEWGREMVHQDLWLMCAEEFFERHAGENIVIDDVRFENEADLIRQMGGMIVHMRRPGLDDTDGHDSEQGVAAKFGDVVIDNDGDQEKLGNVLLGLMVLIEERWI